MSFLTSFEGISVITEHPVATSSPDHLNPCGTAKDNSVNLLLNKKLLKTFRSEGVGLKILDLGCAGGGFVKSCLDQGSSAVGIEGSDYSLKFQRAFWPFLANRFLFTADITKPSSINWISKNKMLPLEFDVNTMWEVFEHIEEASLGNLFENVKKHLSTKGLFFASIASYDCFVKESIFIKRCVRLIGGIEFFKTMVSIDLKIMKPTLT